MKSWLNVAKDFSYGSCRTPQEKNDKGNWEHHFSFDELIFKGDANKGSALMLVSSMPSGLMVSKANAEKIKFPFPLVVHLDASANQEEKVALEILSVLPEGRYSGFLAMSPSAAVASLATGKKADGTDIPEANLPFLRQQVFAAMPVESSLLDPSILDKASSATSGGGFSRSQGELERLTDRVTFLKGFIGVKGDAATSDLASEYALLPPETKELLALILG